MVAADSSIAMNSIRRDREALIGMKRFLVVAVVASRSSGRPECTPGRIGAFGMMLGQSREEMDRGRHLLFDVQVGDHCRLLYY
jgi:hypothetical protein